MADQILIVEDDPKIAAVLGDYLRNDGFETVHHSRGDQVEALVRAGGISLVILDLALPGLNGLEVCKRLRAFSGIPIVMLTARVEEVDRLLGLELGADDYICKPCRVGRTESGAAPTIVIEDENFTARIDGINLELTAVEFHLLKLLVNHPGRIFSRAQLIDSMYADYRVVSERTVDSHVKKLRQKIAARLPDADVVRSVYGLGYKYEP